MQVLERTYEDALGLVQRWLEGRKQNSERTYQWYLYFLKYFPGDNSREAVARFVLKSWQRPDEASRELDEWIIKAKERFSPNTIRTTVAVIRSLLNRAKASNFDWAEIKQDMPKRRRSKDRPPTLEEIRMIFPNLDPRGQFCILFMLSTGSRVGVFEYLSVGDIKAGKDDIGEAVIYRGEREEYTTLFTPECFRAWEKYLDSRKKAGEKILDSSPAVRNFFMLEAPVPAQRASISAIKGYFSNEWKKVGLKSGVRQFKEVHGFRKYFKTSLTADEMQSSYIEILMGHSLGENEESYNRPSIEVLRKAYSKHMRVLYISEEPQLRQAIKEKEGIILSLTEEMHSITDGLRAEIDAMKREMRRN